MQTWASSSLRGIPTAAPSGKHKPGHSNQSFLLVPAPRTSPDYQDTRDTHTHHWQLPQSRSLFKGKSMTTRSHPPAGLTCLKEAAAGMPRACLSSFTSCQALRASHRLMNPGEPFTTANIAQRHIKAAEPSLQTLENKQKRLLPPGMKLLQMVLVNWPWLLSNWLSALKSFRDLNAQLETQERPMQFSPLPEAVDTSPLVKAKMNISPLCWVQMASVWNKSQLFEEAYQSLTLTKVHRQSYQRAWKDKSSLQIYK